MKNQKGLTVIEGLLILVIVSLIGGVGWYVWNTQKESNKSLNSAANTNLSTAFKKKAQDTVQQQVKTNIGNSTNSVGGNVDEKYFSITLPSGWVKSQNDPGSGINGVNIVQYENKSSGDYFIVRVDPGGHDSFGGDYYWTYKVNKDGRSVSITKEEKCVEDDPNINQCGDENKDLSIIILSDSKIMGHEFEFSAGNSIKTAGQGLQIYRDILNSFKAK